MTTTTVLIDGYNLGLEKGTGIATYARNLSVELHNIGFNVDVLYSTRAVRSHQSLLQEIAFFDPGYGGLPWWVTLPVRLQRTVASRAGRRAFEIPMSGRVISRQYRSRLPYYDRIWSAHDIFNLAHSHYSLWGTWLNVNIPKLPAIAHWTYPLPIRIKGAANIYTLHDLVPLRLPYTTLDNKRQYYKMISLILKDADHVVTVSETSKRDICDLFGFPEDRVTNTYQSVDIPEKYSSRSPKEVRDDVEGTFRVKYKDYFLFYGAIEPKKNIARLIEGYLASNVKTPLLIVGTAAWKSDQELRLLNEHSIRYLEQVENSILTRDRIVRIDYAPFPLLVSLIKGAKALLFPSLYEGFGLPVLEAMQLGTPVLASTGGSIPEIAGEAALLVDPYDSAAISSAIVALDNKEDLRAKLSSMGVKQAQNFSPDRFRARLNAMYSHVLDIKAEKQKRGWFRGRVKEP